MRIRSGVRSTARPVQEIWGQGGRSGRRFTTRAADGGRQVLTVMFSAARILREIAGSVIERGIVETVRESGRPDRYAGGSADVDDAS